MNKLGFFGCLDQLAAMASAVASTTGHSPSDALALNEKMRERTVGGGRGAAAGSVDSCRARTSAQGRGVVIGICSERRSGPVTLRINIPMRLRSGWASAT